MCEGHFKPVTSEVGEIECFIVIKLIQSRDCTEVLGRFHATAHERKASKNIVTNLTGNQKNNSTFGKMRLSALLPRV